MGCVCGSKSNTIFADGGGDIPTALKKAIVGIFPFGGSIEFIAAVGVGGKRREETIEVGLVIAVSGEVFFCANMIKVCWIRYTGESQQRA